MKTIHHANQIFMQSDYQFWRDNEGQLWKRRLVPQWQNHLEWKKS